MKGSKRRKTAKKRADFAERLFRHITVLWFAYKDTRTPWYARCLVFLVVAYALSPIDIIPDFIPVLGVLDDLIIVPLGIFICVRLIPDNIMADSRRKAASIKVKPVMKSGIVIIILIWLALISVGGFIVYISAS